MGYAATTINAVSFKENMLEWNGLQLGCLATDSSTDDILYKVEVDFTNIDYLEVCGNVINSNATGIAYVSVEIGGVNKVGWTGSTGHPGSWEFATIDCTSITGSQDIEIILKKSLAGNAVCMNFSASPREA